MTGCLGMGEDECSYQNDRIRHVSSCVTYIRFCRACKLYRLPDNDCEEPEP